LLNRWRDACLTEGWQSTDLLHQFERRPTGHPVHAWSFDAVVTPGRGAHVCVRLETGTDPADADLTELITVLHCYASVSFASMGRRLAFWEIPNFSEPMDDTDAIEKSFLAFELVAGTDLVEAIRRHLSN
jgi:hypothetical protein